MQDLQRLKQELVEEEKLKIVNENMIKDLDEEWDDLKEKNLCIFCPTWKRNEKRMRFLLKEKFKATDEAEELKTKGKRAEHILNIFRVIVDDQQTELGIIRKRVKSLDETMPEYEPSICKRLINFLWEMDG
ncbi:hypothetical protein D4764_08G0010940 [Takifugu flavidus]|uniref:Uncharacterized protein n=1 Tax=Takifugu flavidus TaxID=433684 RepID=A0A5C6MUS8_9TELE|nr:hypothetical protein D4764_08G0010940 [Takifugu flavidus]